MPLESEKFTKDCENIISYKHLQVEDYGAPPLQELDDAVNYINNEISQSLTVVHDKLHFIIDIKERVEKKR